MSKCYWLIISLLIFSLSACFNNTDCKQLLVTTKEKSWFRVYQSGEKVLFKSDRNHIDTFIVGKQIDSYTICNKFELGAYQYNYVSLSLKASNCHGMSKQSFQCGFSLSFTKEHQTEKDKDCFKKMYVFDLYTDELTSMDSVLKETVNSEVSGRRYQTYLFINGKGTDDINGGVATVQSFNWSKEHGLIRYELATGEVYEFWKKI